jgi:hypothetical protein
MPRSPPFRLPPAPPFHICQNQVRKWPQVTRPPWRYAGAPSPLLRPRSRAVQAQRVAGIRSSAEGEERRCIPPRNTRRRSQASTRNRIHASPDARHIRITGHTVLRERCRTVDGNRERTPDPAFAPPSLPGHKWQFLPASSSQGGRKGRRDKEREDRHTRHTRRTEACTGMACTHRVTISREFPKEYIHTE